jgi:hypothetical protein
MRRGLELAGPRAPIPAAPRARVELAAALVAKVSGVGRLTLGLPAILLPEASRLIDEALSMKPGDAAALRVRGDIQALQALVPVRARSSRKHRYRIELLAAPSSASPAGCNGVAAGGLAATFSVVARPLTGFQGRAFRIDADGTLTDIK